MRTAGLFRMPTDITAAGSGAPELIGAAPAPPDRAPAFRLQGRLRPEFPPAPKEASGLHRAQAADRPVRPVVADLQQIDYRQRREAFYGELRSEGVFAWDSMYGEEYALASVHEISREFREELRQASELLGAVYARTVEVVIQGGNDLLAELGVPDAAWDAVRTSLPELLPTVIGRFDFAATSNGLKLLEFNAETPIDIVEAAYVNGKICMWLGFADPNAGMAEQLKDVFARAVRSYQVRGFSAEQIIFSSVDWHDEDAGTTKYLLSRSGLAARFVPLSQLRVFEDRLQIWNGVKHQRVDLMYRLHPLEKLAMELDADGYPTGRHVLDIVARGHLAMINPPASIVAQSKAAQALIWGLHEEGEFFSPEEHEVIQRYMLPTYFENRFKGNAPFVTKPLYGREGGAVTLWGLDGELLARDEEPNYWEQPFIYQQYVELPVITVETLNGLYCGRMVFGSFLLGGKGSGIVARVGSRITGNMAYFLPLSLQSDASKGE